MSELKNLKYICVNIAKTGGTSLSQLLIDNFRNGQVVTTYGPTARYNNLGHLQADYFLEYLSKLRRKHFRKIKLFVGHLPFIHKSLLTFPVEYIVVFRNPVTRIISAFDYSLSNKKISPDYFEYGFHLSCSFEKSLSFFNPILQLMLNKTKIFAEDILKIDDLIDSINHLGVTEEFEWSCQRLMYALGKSYSDKYHLNQGGKIKSLSETTIRTIQYRNHFDILLYNKVCEKLNSERIFQNLPPIPLCDVITASPFSSGDYHPELSCYSAFNKSENSAWVSSAVLIGGNEYIGYDFGMNQERVVREIQIQIMSPTPVRFSLEASQDNFRNIHFLMTFEIDSDHQIHIIKTNLEHSARMWRIRRISESTPQPLIISSISFVPEQKIIFKDTRIIQNKIIQIMAKFNNKTYADALSEGIEK